MSRVTHSDPGLPMVIRVCNSFPTLPKSIQYNFFLKYTEGNKINLIAFTN